jgi:glycerophosphoryl diester phosphodiesterase
MNRLDRNSRSSVEVVAHRGASALAPENTLGAVKLAWKLDADAVEIDVQISADGQLVVIHDETLERTAGRRERVSDLTTEELSQVDVGSWFGDEWAGERVSTLREVVATVPERKRLFVELKCGSAAVDALEGPLANVVLAPQKVALIGFDQEVMRMAKERYPVHEVFLIARQKLDDEVWRPSVDELIEAATAAGLDGLDLLNTLAVDREAVNRIHEAGLSCGVWVVNSLEDAQRLIEAGVESLTMDDPRLLRI